MKLKHTVVSALVAGILGSTAFGQATLTMQLRSAGNVNPGTYREVDVFVNNVGGAFHLLGYQAALQIVPQVGSQGSVILAPESTTGVFKCLGGTNAGGTCTVANSTTDCPGGACSSAVFVDETRADYVYKTVTGGTIAVGTPSDVTFGEPTFGATIISASQSPQVSTPKYVGTYVIHAPSNAQGQFLLRFDPNPNATFLIDNTPTGADTIPYTPTNLTINVVFVVANDNCAAATGIVDGVTPFSTANATTDGPTHTGTACDVGGSATVSNDVWYRYFSSCTGILTVSTCGDANFDTRLAIYNTCTCPISGNGNLVSCSDDAVGCGGGTSELVVNANAGNCYSIRVGGDPGQTGTGNLTITCIPNDTCAQASVLSPPTSVAGATLNANLDGGLPACGPTVGSPGVWYSVTGTGGVLTASLCGAATYDSRITVFQGSCGSLACVGNANNTCATQESFSWCSTPGTQYFILVSGNGGAEGRFTLTLTDLNCNDNNVCTNDSCVAGACANTNNYDPVVNCCNRNNGALAPLSDGNPCTLDQCNSFDGTVTHPPGPDGDNPGCDDGEGCTVDRCFGGVCENIDVETLNIPCGGGNPPCPGDSLCAAGGVCLCGATIELLPQPSVNPTSTCYGVGQFFTVFVDMTAVATVNPIVGAQVFLHYDTSTLEFVSIQPGQTVSPTSPFSFEFTEQVNQTLGNIDYLVGVGFGGAGTLNPSLLAVATFNVIAECEPFVEFRASGPNGELNLLSDSFGAPVVPGHLFDTPAGIRSDSTAPVLSGCPSSQTVNPDPGLFTATVTWASPTSIDGCDGPTPVTCVPPSGSAFPIGTTVVVCSATDSCDIVGSCGFNVTVRDPTMVVDVQLSPNMSAGPFNRCMTFDLWDCGPTGPLLHSTVSQTIPFSSGLASGVTVHIPGGAFDCMTARDTLHTLRSTSPNLATANGFQYTATVVGPRAGGGHWLMGGNLNDDNFIDILDFGIFIRRFLTPANANAPCGTASPDANINGDGVVDLIDFVFVQVNSLLPAEPNCCGAAIAAEAELPVESITLTELRRRGMGDLAVADLNEDGVLDYRDMSAFMGGARPRQASHIPLKTPTTNRNLRGEPR